MEKITLEDNEQKYELTHYRSDTYLAKNEQGNTMLTIDFPTPTATQTTKCIVVNSRACPEFIRGYEPNPPDWGNWEGKYSEGKETYDVFVQGEFLVIKDYQTNYDLVGRAIERNRFMTKEYGLVSFIEVKNTITLEFDHAWRYPKQNAIVASI